MYICSQSSVFSYWLCFFLILELGNCISCISVHFLFITLCCSCLHCWSFCFHNSVFLFTLSLFKYNKTSFEILVFKNRTNCIHAYFCFFFNLNCWFSKNFFWTSSFNELYTLYIFLRFFFPQSCAFLYIFESVAEFFYVLNRFPKIYVNIWYCRQKWIK